ncbi:hypothetical protein AK830_g7762 [Neonectria ditissima]|uniref:Zn(2)-C6 fungal-type domain-containing protein n=1 Tax=Neonectria ditissima TaxID=78410 RepID=A0A0P7BD00_9HYPO|nr:hypothetical protein AK830_g7762 [Neonectria ditissima]
MAETETVNGEKQEQEQEQEQEQGEKGKGGEKEKRREKEKGGNRATQERAQRPNVSCRGSQRWEFQAAKRNRAAIGKFHPILSMLVKVVMLPGSVGYPRELGDLSLPISAGATVAQAACSPKKLVIIYHVWLMRIVRKYVLLRPAPPTGEPDPGQSAPPNENTDNLTQKRRRVGGAGACHHCRRRKIRCDGRHPVCAACEAREEECRYDKDDNASQSDGALLIEAIRLLNSRPPQESAQLLASLRNVSDAEAIMSHLRSSAGPGFDLPPLPSNLVAMRGAAERSFVALELEVRHPFLYPVLPSIDIASPTGVLQRLVHPTIASNKEALPAQKALLLHGGHGGPYPTPPATPYDDRLQGPILGHWTKIPISDVLAAQALSLYFKTDHPLLGPFHADLFINDLVAGSGVHCSSLLVNALMYWVCQMYSAIDDKAGALVNAFAAEAWSLWETERGSPSTLNMAAAMFLSFGYLVQGKDHIVLTTLSVAVRMGIHLGLFGVGEDAAKARTEGMDAQQIKAASHTAWGVFNWIMLMALFYYQPELDYPIHPPYLSIPEEDDVPNVGLAFGPESASPRTRYVGETFPSVCKLWRIMHEVTIAYGKDRSSHQLRYRVSVEFAEFKYRELLAWADNLPLGLVRTKQNPHHVVIFHMWLHAAVLDIFRPFLQRPGQPALQLKTFSPPSSSPDQIYAASVNQLKRLVIVYRMNYESSGFTIVWHTALLYVANAVLQSPNDSEWLFYFLLCLYGYQGLGRYYPVVEAIAGALLSMAMRNGHMSSHVARRILTELKEKSLVRVQGEIRAPFMADLDLAMSDPGAASAENLAGMFEENALMMDYTNMFDSAEA